MKFPITKTFTTGLLLSLVSSTSGFAQDMCEGNAAYEITFQSTWTDSSANAPVHPNAHFSPAYAVTHADGGALYVRGQAASLGIQIMAETGATSIIENETGALGAANLVRDMEKGKRLSAQDRTILTLTTDPERDMLTLVSMIAPSPDWFVGISGFELCQDGQWIDNHAQDLASYDAGTDSGADFGSENTETQPQGVIRFLTRDLGESSVADGAVFGRIQIEKQ